MSTALTRAMCSRPVLQPICAPLEQLTSSSFCLSVQYRFLLVPDREVENSSTCSCQRRNTRPRGRINAVGPYTRKTCSWQDYVHTVAIATSFSHQELRHGCNSSGSPFSYSSILGCFLGHTRVSRKPSSTAPSVRPFTACVVAGADGGARPAARHRFTRSTTIGLASPGIRIPNGHGSDLSVQLPLWCS